MPQKFRYVIDGIGYPSVTEILGAIEKPGLKKWKESTPNSEFISRDRATIGTIVHWRIGRLLALKHSLPLQTFHVDDLSVINHKKCDTPNCYNCYRRDNINLAVNMIMSYYDDFTQAHTLLPVQLEKTVCNQEYGYAGTLDFIGYADDKPCILDFKTAKMISNDSTYGAQLSAYRKAIDDKNKKLYILRMNDETGYELREMIDDWEMFLTALNTFKDKFPERQAQKI